MRGPGHGYFAFATFNADTTVSHVLSISAGQIFDIGSPAR